MPLTLLTARLPSRLPSRGHRLAKAIAASTFGLALAVTGSPAAAGTLSLTIDNIQSTDGKIMISVGNEAAFDGKAPYALQIILPARPGTVNITTDALPEGTWAARVMHDVNDNSEMDSNLVGLPKEPWGISNNARGNFGPPTFEDARFELKGDASMTIRMDK